MEINNNSNMNLFALLKNVINGKKDNIQTPSQKNENLTSLSQLNISNEENLKLILSSMGINYSKNNLDLIKLLLNCGMQINKENLKEISSNLNLFENLPLEKIEFLIKNNFSLSKENALQLENYIKNNTNLTNQLKDLFANVSNKNQLLNILKTFNIDKDISKDIFEIFKSFSNIKSEIFSNIQKDENNLNKLFEIINNQENIENSNILKNFLGNLDIDTKNKKEIIKNFIDFIVPNKLIFDKKSLLKFENNLIKLNSNQNNFEKEIFSLLFKNTDFKIIKDLIPKTLITQKNFIKNISFNFENSDSKELEEFLNNIKENTNKLKLNFEKNDFNNLKLNNSIENINKNLDFISNIKNINFLQIPLNINNNETNAELFIFKDKKNNKNKNNSSGSVLLSLNLYNLGLLETYINKLDNNIFCQFRIKNQQTKKLIENNLNLLDIYLKEKNLNLKEVSFKNIDEKFSLISSNLFENEIKENFNSFNNFNKEI